MTYLHNDAQIFEDAVMLAARQAGIIAPAIEKDYYVTLLLRSLSQKLPYIVFKGGTSLSKCHKIIHRFSEDIDITTDIQLTQGQKKKVKQMIVDSVDELGLSIGNLEDTRSRRDYNCYIINYNSILQTANHNLYPAILLETSYTAISFPTVVLPVYSYIGEMMTKESPDLITAFSMSPFSMKVQDINRTFIDKVFAICDYYLQGKITRHSRHLYDIYKLLPYIQFNRDFENLVHEVRELRATSSICLSAASNVNISELLKQIIAQEFYKNDYDMLTLGLLNEKISYNTVVESLKIIIQSKVFE